MTKVLITGGNGQLAAALRHHARAHEFDIFFLTHNELDITHQLAIQQAIETYSPDIIINTAAYTAVDKAEQETEQALMVNYTGAKNLSLACQQYAIPLIHVSTDYVFDGMKTSAYREEDAVNPVNFYGHSKWLGEQAVREICEQHIILRVSSVFSEYGNNFFKTMLRLAKERTELRVVNDQTSCPTSANDIAKALFQIVASQKKWGTYHFCSANACTWYEFASAIIAAAKEKNDLLVKQVSPIGTAEYPTPAKRPAYSVLNCDKILSDYGVQQPDWELSMRMLVT